MIATRILTSPHAEKVLYIPCVDFMYQTNIHGEDRRIQSCRHDYYYTSSYRMEEKCSRD
jgi:hypothetical protein